MKIFILLLLSLSLFAFEGKKVYECVSKYQIVGGAPHEFSEDEQQKRLFQLVFNQKKTKLRTSDGMMYMLAKSKSKGKLYINKTQINGRTIIYKIKIASANGLYKSVLVRGYGNLVNEYAICRVHKSKGSKKDAASSKEKES